MTILDRLFGPRNVGRDQRQVPGSDRVPARVAAPPLRGAPANSFAVKRWLLVDAAGVVWRVHGTRPAAVARIPAMDGAHPDRAPFRVDELVVHTDHVVLA